MAPRVKHYKRDGSVFRGKTHRMPNGQIHSGATHNSSSVRVYHFGDLSKRAKVKARKSWRK